MIRSMPFILLLAACQPAAADPVAAAKACINDHPGPKKLAASQASQLVIGCKKQLDAWAVASIERAYGKPLDREDGKMLSEFRARRHAIAEIMLNELSDEVKPTHYRS